MEGLAGGSLVRFRSILGGLLAEQAHTGRAVLGKLLGRYLFLAIAGILASLAQEFSTRIGALLLHDEVDIEEDFLSQFLLGKVLLFLCLEDPLVKRSQRGRVFVFMGTLELAFPIGTAEEHISFVIILIEVFLL